MERSTFGLSIVLALTLLSTTAALRPTSPSILRPNTPSRTSPSTFQRTAPPSLVAENKPSTTGNVAAGVYSGLATVIDAAAFTSIVFGPVGLPLTIGLQHALAGFVVMQLLVTRLSAVGFTLVPTSYEVMPFLARFAAVIAAAGVGGASLLATVLAGSVVVGLLGAVLVALSAEAPVDEVEKLLPPALQAGLFAAIGWSLYLLAFDSLGLSFSLSSSMLSWASARLWLPANALGLGLWLATKKIDSPLLFPGFIASVTAVVHAVRIITGTTLAGARSAGWLMAEAAGAPATQLYASLSPALVRWDLIFSMSGFSLLLSAALFGPVVNTVLNYLLFGPLFKRKLNLKRELRTHAAGAAAAAATGGYSSYVALSNTAIHQKVGGTDRLSTYVAAAVCALFLVAHPLCASVGYVPTLVIGAICVYIGADFLWDNLVEPFTSALPTIKSATFDIGALLQGIGNALMSVIGSWAVLLICVKKDMLLGTVLGVAGFQIAAFFKKRKGTSGLEGA